MLVNSLQRLPIKGDVASTNENRGLLKSTRWSGEVVVMCASRITEQLKRKFDPGLDRSRLRAAQGAMMPDMTSS